MRGYKNEHISSEENKPVSTPAGGGDYSDSNIHIPITQRIERPKVTPI